MVFNIFNKPKLYHLFVVYTSMVFYIKIQIQSDPPSPPKKTEKNEKTKNEKEDIDG